MSTRIALLAPTLDFVLTGNTIHARETGVSLYDANYDFAKHTLCGRALTTGVSVLSDTRTLHTAQVCKRCLASLRTYTGRFGSVPMARFYEQESEAAV